MPAGRQTCVAGGSVVGSPVPQPLRPAPLRTHLVGERDLDRLVEDALEARLREGGTLHILHRADLRGQPAAVGKRTRPRHGARGRETRDAASAARCGVVCVPDACSTPPAHALAARPRAHRSPSSGVLGALASARRRSTHSSLWRRSALVPTRMKGTPGAWCRISGHHCSRSRWSTRRGQGRREPGVTGGGGRRRVHAGRRRAVVVGGPAASRSAHAMLSVVERRVWLPKQCRVLLIAALQRCYTGSHNLPRHHRRCCQPSGRGCCCCCCCCR